MLPEKNSHRLHYPQERKNGHLIPKDLMYQNVKKRHFTSAAFFIVKVALTETEKGIVEVTFLYRMLAHPISEKLHLLLEYWKNRVFKQGLGI